MASLHFVLGYLWKVFWGWQALAFAVLGLNEMSEWLFHHSIKKLHERRWTVALVLLFVAQAVAYHDLSVQQGTAAVAPTSPVVAENPDHAEQLKELKRLQEIEEEFNDRTQELGQKDAEIQRLQLGLSDKQKRELVVNGLAKLSAQLTELRNNCRTIAPPEFVDRAGRLLDSAVTLMRDSGLANDAQRLADGRTGQIGGRVSSPTCTPYDENSNYALGILVRLIVIDDVITNLGR